MTETKAIIASVSLSQPPQSIAEELGRSFAEYGFAVVRDHGISQELIERAEEASKAFFALPENVKKSYKLDGGGGARGYTPFGTEKAMDADVFDLKEFCFKFIHCFFLMNPVSPALFVSPTLYL